MPTNDERRKIAAELRENRDPLTPYNLVDYIFDDPWNHDGGEEVAARLAELIEPEERTCRNIANETDREFGIPFICSECGADPHDAESYYCGFSSGEYDWRFCPNCGARVTHDA